MAGAEVAVSVERQLELRRLLAGFITNNAVAQFGAVAREMFVPAGRSIYLEGDTSRHVHLIMEGKVELSTEGAESWFFDRRGVIGILDAEIGRPYTRTARAVSDVRLMTVKVEDWTDIIEDNFQMQILAIRGTAKALERMAASLPGGAFRELRSDHHRPSLLVSTTPDNEVNDGLNPFERLLTLRLCPIFEHAGTQSLIRVARAAVVRSVAAGERFIQQGERATSLFVVAAGGVAVERDDPAWQANFGPTDLVGGWAGFGHIEWPVAARAAGDPATSVLLEISYDDLFDVMEDHFELSRAVRGHTSREIERLNRLTAGR